ncbi:MAG: NRAMP family divalent metal transporter [Bacteroidota bacterium]
MLSRIRAKFKFLDKLGPGIVTGASDDDPSGIVTYSHAGTVFGLSTLWTAWFSFPLMASMQEMCARIGLVTSSGLTGVLKRHYPAPVLYMAILFSFPAITLNIGADIAGMGAVSNMLFPTIPSAIFSVIYTIVLLAFIIYLPYRRLARIMKWLCIALLAYIIVPFLTDQQWPDVLYRTLIPDFKWEKDYLFVLVGILGTTISPYLFFWQTSMEVEEKQENGIVVDKQVLSEMRTDVDLGMFFSCTVMFFIMLATGTLLHGKLDRIDSVEQAAQALLPLAGRSAYLLFAIGILGTGVLAIPVLAGSLSYITSETFGWTEGLNKKFHEARGFYVVMVLSVLIALLVNFLGISPIKILIYTAVLYGLTAPVMIAVILHICNNKAIMGENTNGRRSNILGMITLVVMSSAAIGLIWSLF